MRVSHTMQCLSLLFAGSMFLTGCGFLKSDTTPNSESSFEATGTATMTTRSDLVDTQSNDPTVAITSIVKKMSDLSKDSKSGLSIAGRNAQNILGKENSDALQQTPESQEKLRSMSPSVLEKLASNYSDYDVLSLYYDTSNMNDADKVILSIYMMGVSSTFSATPEPIKTINIPQGSITVSGNEASVDLSQATYDTATATNRTLPLAATKMTPVMYFKKTGEQWKLDGQKMVSNLK